MNCKTDDLITTNKMNQRNSLCEDANRLRSAGFTLLELIIVLVILVALAGIIVPVVSESSRFSREAATKSSMAEVRDALLQFYADNHELPEFPTGRIDEPTYPQLVMLFRNPETVRDSDPNNDVVSTWNRDFATGWRGPYLVDGFRNYLVGPLEAPPVDVDETFTSLYGINGDPCALDGWQNPIVLHLVSDVQPLQVRLVSAGPNQRIDTAYDAAAGTESELDITLTFYLK